ncbi:SAM-dependent methyltransferase [Streptomyces samsunensis]|uniref:SAM-dependent methyltransferase n=1 Tax=Streptomyces TaxID=1883 RepID=UPI00081DDC91|nr:MULTISPECIES: SAM-dependent methyltransferase [Streptomyces]MYU13945.1 SAM-dependent methyltransferase [Streptomyces sp. SID8361]AUA08664.1 S-adenosyl methyltransferase [Streptomyces sp. M56]MCC4315366.1 SAM-dependent methyltransferase [Streptomyces malaysiensis]MCD9586965.1 SAM-dependent methyltransferase [Streptomyces sp. 8ZJF_21]MCM3808414.1 SAM-dependent methyltransferase [Streptomyces sp. DR7-3]
MTHELPNALNLRTDKAHSARMYDFYLGGKDNYEADREAAARVAASYPGIFVCARENRAFMHRATRVLARDHGIRQWLDIGTGIPTKPNLHEVAQSVAPDARIVYVDNDPIVLVHAQTLLNSSAEGRTDYIRADVNEPDTILRSPELSETLDLTRPVVLSLNALMHFVTDAQDAHGIVRRLMDALPSGSALALSHCTPDFDPETWQKVTDIYNQAGTPVQFRDKAAVTDFFAGLDLIEPGIVVGHRWRPATEDGGADREDGPAPSDADVSLWAGVGIKP